jgi:hypothetical protein
MTAGAKPVCGAQPIDGSSTRISGLQPSPDECIAAINRTINLLEISLGIFATTWNIPRRNSREAN